MPLPLFNFSSTLTFPILGFASSPRRSSVVLVLLAELALLRSRLGDGVIVPDIIYDDGQLHPPSLKRTVSVLRY